MHDQRQTIHPPSRVSRSLKMNGLIFLNLSGPHTPSAGTLPTSGELNSKPNNAVGVECRKLRDSVLPFFENLNGYE